LTKAEFEKVKSFLRNLADGQSDRQTDIQMDGQTDKGVNR